ncbi:hypothetical protein F0L68_25515 [Solihabitans fulvus]|uniref:Septum formation-related domain-containing protein n=1 Tax=Solihabitans fulvus TaxID=1892852 RepID=A0A5B2X1Q4_9PSEU|nr:hypothetical protein F0L68_25515 [Solihabitans fulvus]
MVMLGAVAGAFALLASSTLTSWPMQGGSLHAEDASRGVNIAYAATAGQCLAWSKPDLSDATKVGCDAEHMFEVTGTADVSAKYGKDAKFPDATLWQKIGQDSCTDTSTKYLAGKLDPFGRYGIGALKPGSDRWQSGNRTLQCGLQVIGPSGSLFATVGSAKQQDQSDVHEVGTCLGIQGKTVSDPVECSQPHSWEIVGLVDLGQQFPDYPSVDKQDAALADQCGKLAADYTGGMDLKAKKLGVAWDNRAQESWAAGSHRVNCKIGSMEPDGSGLVAVTGSVRNPGAPPLTTSAKPRQTPVKPQQEPTGDPMHPMESGQSSAPPATSGSAPPSSGSASSPAPTSSSSVTPTSRS